MHTNKQSSLGDWLFLIAGIGFIGGYLLYDNPDQVTAWRVWFQSIGNTPIPAGSIWLLDHWGLLLLILAVVFAVIKTSNRPTNTAITEDGNKASYRSYRTIKVKVIQ